MSGEWKGKTMGGCPNFPTWKNNPQYLINLSEPSQLTVILTQSQKEKLPYIGFYIIKSKDEHNAKESLPREDVIVKSSFSNGREVTCELELKPSTTQDNYIIVPSTFEPNWENTFTLTIYSNKKITLKETRSSSSSTTTSNLSIISPSGSSGTTSIISTSVTMSEISDRDLQDYITTENEYAWFVLKGTRIFFFQSPLDSKPNKIVSLKRSHIVEDSLSMDLHTSDGVFTLYTKSEEEQRSWVTAINNSIEKASAK